MKSKITTKITEDTPEYLKKIADLTADNIVLKSEKEELLNELKRIKEILEDCTNSTPFSCTASILLIDALLTKHKAV